MEKLLFGILIVIFITPPTFAASKEIIFYLDDNYMPVVKVEKLAPMSDGIRAILAMYALQNGAGCTGFTRGDDNLRCLLTETLNLGGQCSDEHINLVRTWFKKSIPKMSGYAERIYKNTQKIGDLEAICYRSPEGASFQQIWDIIRITTNKNRVIIDAHGSWVAREEYGSFRYITEYEIGETSVSVVSHKKMPIVKKK